MSAASPPRIVPLHGHDALRARLADAARAGRLPASLLLHGEAGIGKQRIALWLGAVLLCEQQAVAPCGECAQCRLSLAWRHPDLHWFFPRPRPKDPDPSPDDVLADLAESIEARIADGGLYPLTDPTDALFVATIRALVRTASVSPALAARRVFVVGQADRLVAQEGSDQAANAFLKLLEEPPRNSWLILTSSEPAALLPTIRSRLVAIRVAPVADSDWQRLLADPTVGAAVEKSAGLARARSDERRALGRLLGGGDDAHEQRVAAARALLAGALAPDRADGRAARARAAFIQGAAGARGSFAGVLDQLVSLLGEASRDALAHGDGDRADRLARSMVIVEQARLRTGTNANPSLLAYQLLDALKAEVGA